jgi:hypothetical protein
VCSKGACVEPRPTHHFFDSLLWAQFFHSIRGILAVLAKLHIFCGFFKQNHDICKKEKDYPSTRAKEGKTFLSWGG